MSNTFNTTQYVLDETFVRFVNYLQVVKTANRNLEGDFKSLKYATGQTLNYRLEERYLGGRGATATSEARVQVVRPLSITEQFHTMVEFTGFELTFDRARDQPYLDMMLNPRAKKLANDIEKYVVSENFQNKTYQAIGTPGTPIDFLTLAKTRAYMNQLGIPDDGNRYIANDPMVSASLSNDLKGVFNNTVNRGALMDGFIGHMAGLDMFESVFLRRQVAGVGGGGAAVNGFITAGTVTNGPVSSGNTLTLTGLAASQQVFNDGDSIEIADAAGVYMINPLTYQALQQRAQFVVVGNVTADPSGNATVTVSPSIVTSGARQNISGPIPNGATVLLAASHNVSIAYQSQAVVFAAPPIQELKGGVECQTTYSDLYKMAITYTLGADIRNFIQLDRLDIIAGVAINPEFAIRIRS